MFRNWILLFVCGQGTVMSWLSSVQRFSFRHKSVLDGSLLHSTAISEYSTNAHVYIEMTDCFNVMYYANYPVLMERAMSSKFQHGMSFIKSAKNIKYKRPARLGDNLTLTIACLDTGVMNGKILGPNKDELVVMTKVELSGADEKDPSTCTKPTLLEGLRLFATSYKIWPDEVQCHDNSATGQTLLLPTKTIFNLFERSRTDLLGGPSSLAAIQQSNFHIYVARVSNYRVVNRCMTPTFNIGDSHGINPQWKLELKVWNQCVPRGDSIVDFQHQLVKESENGILELLVEATVTTVCVDAQTGLAAPFPASVKSRFQFSE